MATQLQRSSSPGVTAAQTAREVVLDNSVPLTTTASSPPPPEARSVAVSSEPLPPVVPLPRVRPDPLKASANFSCTPLARHPSLGPPRALQWVAPKESDTWPVNCAGREDLCDVLRKTAVNREVMVAVANSAAPGLSAFLASVKKLNISNFMVVAIDQALADALKQQGVPHYFKPNSAQGNHKVSAQKFSLLRSFVAVGCSVLLTDTDVVYVRNPLPFLYRDADVESMTDGWDADTAFGWLDPLDDVSMGAQSPLRRGHTLRAAALNSGLWFVQATHPVLSLMTVMEHRMATEDLWDQAGYNMELFLPTHDAHAGARAHVRVMSPLCFVNSKVLFRHIRFATELRDFAPVAIHVNYHADKENKMHLAVDRYLNKVQHALDKCMGDGCARGMAPVSALEAGARAGVNDGFAGSRAAMTAMSEAKSYACEPRTPWNGKLDTEAVAYPLAGRLPPPSGLEAGDDPRQASAASTTCPSAALELCTALMAAARVAAAAGRPAPASWWRPSTTLPHVAPSPEVVFVVVDATSALYVEPLLKSVQQQKMAGRTVVVALDETASSTVSAAAAGVQMVHVSSGSPLRVDATGAALPGSAVKWRCVGQALRMGVSLLVLDPDTLLTGDPFSMLYRDSDLEAAPDGWDETSVWGYDHVVDDPSMGWSRYCHGTRMATRDPGLVMVHATSGAVLLADRMAARLAAGAGANATERGVFNQETWLPSALEYVSVGVSMRVMNFMCAANSKTVTTLLLKAPLARSGFAPRAIRASYTPPALKAAFLSGALDEFGTARRGGAIEEAMQRSRSGGGKGPGGESVHHPGCAVPTTSLHTLSPQEGSTSALAAFVTRSANWSWAGVTPFVFEPAGMLSTPWGKGTWGLVPGPQTQSTPPPWLFADFAGTHTVLEFEPVDEVPFGMFASTRCADGDIVIGRPMQPVIM